MINNWLADMRTWAVCLIAYCAACTSAVACVLPGTPASLIGILFEHVPTDIDAPAVIEATIYDATDNVSYAHDSTFSTITLMKARVDRVIKGSIDAKYLKLFVYTNSCAHIGVGRGIVLGTLRDDPQRGIMLEAIQKADMRDWSKEFFAKHVAIHDATKCFKNEFGARECRLPGIGPESTQP
ncbi:MULTISPECIES: hypothetical protein [unclassified Bradyrhizobium]|uniref:hypothetical protein n=1 Tax=unclassified Bradyrhizobium TaxID=2631580 RepID=UPI001BA57017|nr:MULTISPECIES: hypothetical protein [unclassified Bradyrhizobium]MBR1206522.1 hypothetical protein [Bradyrhizobium sp. AUGA SZCCT0124]MBR1315500.1 hypothetical protein [Bradyrhizobium sp. AUGA SZCCT0051]MBR1338438.1 hypothetical protein [Bradyrhizobium sp. AUGA SZCCT0105]MBR1356093.1 hypothetical protein [Bradyrhizobium sp. AUGA SZCCT0045]